MPDDLREGAACPECGLVLSAAWRDDAVVTYQHSDYDARRYTTPCVVTCSSIAAAEQRLDDVTDYRRTALPVM